MRRTQDRLNMETGKIDKVPNEEHLKENIRQLEKTHTDCQDWRQIALQARDALKELLMHGCAVPDKDGNAIPYQANPDYAREVIDAIDSMEVK